PYLASGNVRKNGDATPIGWIAEPRSCRNPGSVSSAVRAPPPMVSLASSTSTSAPRRASVTAAASPFGPAPTTTASCSGMFDVRYEKKHEVKPRDPVTRQDAPLPRGALSRTILSRVAVNGLRLRRDPQALLQLFVAAAA